MKLFVALTALCVAALVVPKASSAPANNNQQSIKATLDFIAHEQTSGEAAARPALTLTTPRTPQRQSIPTPTTPSMPKKDWEPVPPRQAATTSPRPYITRPTPPSYAGVVKNRHDSVVLPTLPPLPSTTTRSRVYNIPVVVEDRGNYTTTTEQSRWYDKLFGRGTDVDDDSPWGRRRRQAPEAAGRQRGEEREEVVIGSNAIRVKGNRQQSSQSQSRPKPSRQ